MALLGKPRLLLLDEPMAGLAPAESSTMISMLKNIDETISMIIIEHDMDVAFKMADTISVLHYGQILSEGKESDIRGNPKVAEVYLGHT